MTKAEWHALEEEALDGLAGCLACADAYEEAGRLIPSYLFRFYSWLHVHGHRRSFSPWTLVSTRYRHGILKFRVMEGCMGQGRPFAGVLTYRATRVTLGAKLFAEPRCLSVYFDRFFGLRDIDLDVRGGQSVWICHGTRQAVRIHRGEPVRRLLEFLETAYALLLPLLPPAPAAPEVQP